MVEVEVTLRHMEELVDQFMDLLIFLKNHGKIYLVQVLPLVEVPFMMILGMVVAELERVIEVLVKMVQMD